MSTKQTTWEDVVALIADQESRGREIAVAARRIGDDKSWGYHPGLRLPAASTIKLALLVALHQAVDAGRLDLAAKRPATPAQRVIGSGVETWLSSDLQLTLADHAYLMIAISDNTASNVIIDAVGMPEINTTIEGLGLREMHLGRRFLGRHPEPDEGENYTSAADLVTLLTAIATDTAASPAACATMRETLLLQQYRDSLPRLLPPEIQFGGKSGWLDGIAHDSGLITGPGGTLAVAVTTRGFFDKYEAHALMGEIGLALAREAGIVAD